MCQPQPLELQGCSGSVVQALSTSAVGLQHMFPMPPFCYLSLSPKKTNAQLFNILLMISNNSLQERGHHPQPGRTIWHSAVSCSGYPPQDPGM